MASPEKRNAHGESKAGEGANAQLGSAATAAEGQRLQAEEAFRVLWPVEVDPAVLTPPFDWNQLFGSSGPVEIDVGCGKGRFLKEAALRRPDVLFLGIERAGKYYRRAAKRLGRAGISNAKVFRADAMDVFQRWIPPHTVSVVHVYFPDPWPKKRHHKRRLFRPEFMDLLKRALIAGGEVRVATDHDEYATVIREMFSLHRDSFEETDWAGDPEGEVTTNYLLKWKREGRDIWWARFRLRMPVVPDRRTS